VTAPFRAGSRRQRVLKIFRGTERTSRPFGRACRTLKSLVSDRTRTPRGYCPAPEAAQAASAGRESLQSATNQSIAREGAAVSQLACRSCRAVDGSLRQTSASLSHARGASQARRDPQAGGDSRARQDPHARRDPHAHRDPHAREEPFPPPPSPAVAACRLLGGRMGVAACRLLGRRMGVAGCGLLGRPLRVAGCGLLGRRMGVAGCRLLGRRRRARRSCRSSRSPSPARHDHFRAHARPRPHRGERAVAHVTTSLCYGIETSHDGRMFA
jgi:hypothetical protein